LKFLRIQFLKLLLWLIHQIGFKSKLHRLQCPICMAQSFMIDSYLFFYLNGPPDSGPSVLKLDLEISDAVILCRHCGEEIKMKDAAIELIRRVISAGATWIKL